MSIREREYQPPIEISELSDGVIKKTIKAFQGKIVETIHKQGDYDVTDRRWNRRSHNWKLRVRSDGTGVLHMAPLSATSVISEIDGSESSEIAQAIRDEKDDCHLLGFQTMDGGRMAAVVFKTLSFVAD